MQSSVFRQRYAPHRHLHSFPTRRSSDLPAASSPRATTSPSEPTSPSTTATSSTPARCWPASRARPPRPRTSPAVYPASPRSEEHTSELQSQFHLVCRLLLEKKKDICNQK